MTKCVDIPSQPNTTIHGYVTDAVTGQPVSNLQMQVVTGQGYYNNDNRNKFLVTTQSDGGFYLNFIPPGTETFYLKPIQTIADRYSFSAPEIKLGRDNSFNLKVFKLVFVSIHLTNNSDHNKSDYELIISSAHYLTGLPFAPPKFAITTSARLPQLAQYTFRSNFFNGYTPAGIADSVSFIKTISVGTADTAVTINNP